MSARIYTGPKQNRIEVAPARVDDVERMHHIINHFADRDEMLHRSYNEIYENLRDYQVVRDGDRLIGCVALHVNWHDLAELKALAVDEHYQGLGIGRALCLAVLEDAKQLGIAVVFVLTYRPSLFEAVGFRQVPMSQLPRKVWGECFRCPKFNDCHEIPLIYEVIPGSFDGASPASVPLPFMPIWERPKRP